MKSIPFVLSAAAFLLSPNFAGPISRRKQWIHGLQFPRHFSVTEIVWTSYYDNFTCAMLQVLSNTVLSSVRLIDV